MSTESVRSRLPRPTRQYGDPPEGGDRPAIPDPRGEECEGACQSPAAGRLWREDGRVMYQPAEGGPPEAARVVWARPLSGRGGPVSVLMAGKKRELAFFASPGDMPADARAVAMEELARGMILPRITAIHRVRPRFGNYYWDVETDMGPRKFLLQSPENNSFRPTPDTIVVRDVSENCYEINPVSGLSRSSRRELDRVL